MLALNVITKLSVPDPPFKVSAPERMMMRSDPLPPVMDMGVAPRDPSAICMLPAKLVAFSVLTDALVVRPPDTKVTSCTPTVVELHVAARPPLKFTVIGFVFASVIDRLAVLLIAVAVDSLMLMVSTPPAAKVVVVLVFALLRLANTKFTESLVPVELVRVAVRAPVPV